MQRKDFANLTPVSLGKKNNIGKHSVSQNCLEKKLEELQPKHQQMQKEISPVNTPGFIFLKVKDVQV